MKRVTNFIVDKRYFILITFILLSAFSLYLGTKVNINYDISEYLPSTSETRIGMDIMNSNFEEIKESSLNVMFKNVDNEKLDIKERLEKIDNVDSVLYDDTSDYNNGDYTLYIVNVKDVSDSETAKKVYDSVNAEFKDYDMYLSGSINTSNKPVLHISIVIIAICFAMVILIIMCESYIEPFLFLFVIGLAVFMNKGTNIIFPSVSHITNAISAILQMALSMDYSIMLMNRYIEEREKEKDNKKAMKNALFNAFKSISSSSVTTIVGLLALVFMSFTIGRDLGFVLAKGVLFSLISIFLCLPALILLFDKLILKTKKKSLNIKLNTLGKLSYKLRFPVFIIFIGLFVASYFVKNGLGILYTDSETDKVAEYFKENNQMAIIYNNEYEDLVSNYCRNLKDDNVDEVLCYGNTINQKLSYEELPKKLEDLGSSTTIEDYLLKILYYNYYNKENNYKMTSNDFLLFIEQNIYTNDNFNSKLNDNMRNNISKLHNFTDINSIYALRNVNETSYILGIDEETIQSLYILYNSENIDTQISLNEFVNFLNNYILPNDKYFSYLDENSKYLVYQMTPFVNTDIINREMNALELSNLFGIDVDSIKQLLLLYYSNIETNNKLSLEELVTGIEYLGLNTNYLDGVDVSSLISLKQIIKNENNINSTKMNKIYLKQYFKDIDEALVDTVYIGANLPDNYLMTPQEFINFTLTNFSAYLSEDSKSDLTLLKFIISESVKEEKSKYTSTEISNILNVDKNSMYGIYALIGYINNYEYKVSPNVLVNLILSNRENPLISSKLDENTINKLILLSNIMYSVNNNIYYSVSDLSNFLSVDKNNLSLLYSLYDVIILNKNIQININDFINYLLSKVITNEKYASNFNGDSINKLKTIRYIIDGTINYREYISYELYDILSPLSSDLDKNLIDLIYLYSGSINNYNNDWTLTIETFAHYLDDEILTDDRFSDFIDDNRKSEIKDSVKMVDDAKKMLVSDNYSRMIINTIYKEESEETFEFIQSIKDSLDSENKDIYVIGDSPMAYDMSNSFGSELEFITILTMLSIFVVVAITFRSIIIPLILVLIIQCAVYLTMGILSVFGGSVYFIALLIVQSILMGATIDYAIVYTSYYKESRNSMNVVDSIKNAYNKSIHTILTSASILIIVTLVVGNFASAIASKICKTLSEGTICSVILILFVLPSVLAVFDRFICRKNKEIV